MAIPNTTPTPNELYNGEMKKMSDTELRVVLVVTRSTLGWEMDHETGMRKQEDWISHKQLKEKTGRGSAALCSAIDSCIKKEWIEARNAKGDILDTKNKREGKKIYFRLGRVFLDKIQAVSESETPAVSHSEISESETDKRNTITKEKLTKIAAPKVAAEWNFNKYLEEMDSNKRRDINIIAFFFREKRLCFDNKKQVESAIKRHLRPAKDLVPFTDEQISKAADKAEAEFPGKWTLETLLKILSK